MGNKRDQAAARAASRPTSPVTPVQSSTYRCPSASPDKKKPAWVVADWKHRVPYPGLMGRVSSAGSLHTQARVSQASQGRMNCNYSHFGMLVIPSNIRCAQPNWDTQAQLVKERKQQLTHGGFSILAHLTPGMA